MVQWSFGRIFFLTYFVFLSTVRQRQCSEGEHTHLTASEGRALLCNCFLYIPFFRTERSIRCLFSAMTSRFEYKLS